MKHFTLLLFLSFITISVTAQTKLSDKDFNNLIALGELYSHNNMCTGAEFAKKVKTLKTPVLDHIIENMIATGKQDSSTIQKSIFQRPNTNELKLWYVIREIHYNRVDTSRKSLPDEAVARKILNENIDERWLLDNYYYFAREGLSMYFNEADLSHFNFNLDDFGLKDDTEKAIFFYNLIDALANGRFRVLSYLKKPDKLSAVSARMPMFNGKPYYYYSNLDIPDFDYIGYNKSKSYQKQNADMLINTLLIHFSNLASTGDKFHARELYFNSILHKPEFFKYSQSKETLQTLYDQSNK
ncbi:hypothetical protein SAMN05192574_11297 [Mucilaginibacter gossypiicola]|uniref:Uncharacterized protein n=1 Tax=Mucilaginibacter gossypiicola TaxID=551995 RepID=A0A1H8SDE1_9SPHI|nr:hypothetical protein [Mucilaginibacter gossypiicola]SEO76298.1 hypothetical protein SAMN05192574_11297 [Mucilaginibacter gossypiicola]